MRRVSKTSKLRLVLQQYSKISHFSGPRDFAPRPILFRRLERCALEVFFVSKHAASLVSPGPAQPDLVLECEHRLHAVYCDGRDAAC